MIRLGAAEYVLTRISEADRKLIKDLAHCRGCLTLKEFASIAQITVVGARQKIKKTPFDLIYKSLRLDSKAKAAEFFLLRSRYGRIYSNSYREPKSIKTILDALLRVQVHLESGIWQHNLRHAAYMRLPETIHIADCLDRSESAVLTFAGTLSATQVILHTLSPSRFAAFQMLKSRSIPPVEQATQEEPSLGWDDIWKNNPVTPATSKPSTISSIEIKLHELPIIRTLQV